MRFDKEYHEYLQGNCKDYNQSLVCALKEMEKGGENIMMYGDDQCEECGGIRVAKSKLCADCLVKACTFKDEIIRHLTDKKKILEERLEDIHRQLEETLAYGFKQNQENTKLHRYIRELEELITRSWEDKLW